MEIGEEMEPVEVPIPAHPDEQPAVAPAPPAAPVPEPAEPERMERIRGITREDIHKVEADMAWWVFDQVCDRQRFRCRSGETYEVTDGEPGEPFTMRRVSDGALFEVGFVPEVDAATSGVTVKPSEVPA